MPDQNLERLLQLLAAERAALLIADFEKVIQLGKQKITHLEELDEASADPAALAIVKVDLAHNQALLAAAISGISTANARLSALAKVRGNLSVYDKEGQISKVSVAPPIVERKA